MKENRGINPPLERGPQIILSQSPFTRKLYKEPDYAISLRESQALLDDMLYGEPRPDAG